MFKFSLLFGAAMSATFLPHVIDNQACLINQPLQPVAADAVVAFSFGKRLDDEGKLQPDPVNQRLYQISHQLAQQSKLPALMQWEVAEHANWSKQEPLIVNHVISPIADRYLSTEGVAQQVKTLAGQVDMIYVVAHEAHVCRCVAALQRLGIEAIPAPAQLPNHFDSESAQPWTRHLWLYRYVDFIKRLMA